MAEVAIMILVVPLCVSFTLLANHSALANGKQPPAASSDSPANKETSSSELDPLIRQLGSADFREREAAERKLQAIGKPALSALRKAEKEQIDPEGWTPHRPA